MIFLVVLTSLAILGTAGACAIPAIIPLYAGMGGILFYMIGLALYMAHRHARHEEKTYIPVEIDLGGDLMGVFSSLEQPCLVIDRGSIIRWANPAFLRAANISAVEEGIAMERICGKATDAPLSERIEHLCRIGEGVYRYDIVPMPEEDDRFLVTFRDLTELDRLEAEYALLNTRHEDSETVVAYAMLDNLEEMSQHIQDNFRTAANSAAKKLHAWVFSMGGILRSYDRDKYLILFNKFHLEECIKDRFCILDEIRGIHVGDGVPVTVSIGVCCTSGTLYEKEQIAQSALDVALQRGGDQVVYRSETGTDYFGGKTKAIYKRANVRARAVGQQLLTLFAYADNVLVMGHKYGDFDSFGSAVGVARLAVCCGVADVHIVCNENEPNLSPCFEKLASCKDYDIPFISTDDAPSLVRKKTLLVIVDVNNIPNTVCEKLYDMVEDVVIIDHHTQTQVFTKEPTVSYIEPSASSASELVAEILEQFLGAKKLLKEEAELMLTGILLDTKQLIHNTGTRTFGAAYFLRGEGADPGETNKFFKDDVKDLAKQGQFLTNVTTYKEILAIAVCEGNTDPSYRVIAAKAANTLLSGKDIAASFTLVNINGSIHISGRSNGTVNVAQILEELGGGGHFDSAGAQVTADDVEEIIVQLKHAIDKYVI